MVEKVTTPGQNVIDFVSYQRALRAGDFPAISARCCRHCGAALGDGDSEDDCSSIGAAAEYPARARPPRRFVAD